jgi:uncharacterized protein (TIGR02118 family)
MYKLIVHIDRQDGMDEAAFHDHWENEHVLIVKQVPNLVKYTTSVPVEPEAADFDGIADPYFEEREHVGAAIESEKGSETRCRTRSGTTASP